ncbi:MAG TPA: YihY/virulence factor BrkB family protein [Longimicrobium sp.]|nr:YihY/virulence factor BrkB family protein [Longimicrobium sp.]
MVAVVVRFWEHGMPVYAAALAYRGVLALVPFVLVVLSLFDWLGVGNALPRLTAPLPPHWRDLGDDGTAASMGGLLSAGAAVGIWSMSTGSRLLMRALNTAHQIKEGRPQVSRFTFSLVFLPVIAAVIVVATVLLLLTSQVVDRVGGWLGMSPVLHFLASWLRLPTALALLGLAVCAVYRLGPGVRPPYRAVAAGATLTMLLWMATSAAFGWALSTVLDYGSTYGSLGAAVALLVYLHLTALVLLLGAEMSAEIASP